MTTPPAAARVVKVVPYDPGWPAAFRAEALSIGIALGDAIAEMHHIGSTSVPGLSAKPTIDMLGVTHQLSAVAARDPALEALGYQACGPAGVAGRLYYRKEVDGQRTHHLHVYARGSDHIRRTIGFRNFLAATPKTRNAYSDLKERLAARHPSNMQKYIDGKDRFIQNVDQQVARGFEPWPDA